MHYLTLMILLSAFVGILSVAALIGIQRDRVKARRTTRNR
jgi:hypothetical protein